MLSKIIDSTAFSVSDCSNIGLMWRTPYLPNRIEIAQMRRVFFQELTCRAKPSTMNSQWAFLNWSFRRFFKLTSLSCYVERRSHLSIRNFATSPSCWKPCSSFISFQLCIWLRTLTCLVRASLARSAFARFSSKVVFSLGLPRNMAVVCLHLFNETPIRVTSHTVISLQLICTLVNLYSCQFVLAIFRSFCTHRSVILHSSESRVMASDHSCFVFMFYWNI